MRTWCGAAACVRLQPSHAVQPPGFISVQRDMLLLVRVGSGSTPCASRKPEVAYTVWHVSICVGTTESVHARPSPPPPPPTTTNLSPPPAIGPLPLPRSPARTQDAFFYYNTETGTSAWARPPPYIPVRLSGWWVLPPPLPRGKCCVCRTTDSDRACSSCTFDDEADEIAQVGRGGTTREGCRLVTVGGGVGGAAVLCVSWGRAPPPTHLPTHHPRYRAHVAKHGLAVKGEGFD
jgi:hypothetical protein